MTFEFNRTASFKSGDYFKTPKQYEVSPHAYQKPLPPLEAFGNTSIYNASTEAKKPTSSSGALKKHPCRFRDAHNCHKMFTTSGHASRHSKVHTAEKAIQCEWPTCEKRFTRHDNMKQHLQTHNKDGVRSSGGAAKLASRTSISSRGGIRKSGVFMRRSMDMSPEKTGTDMEKMPWSVSSLEPKREDLSPDMVDVEEFYVEEEMEMEERADVGGTADALSMLAMVASKEASK
jgi:hypothetical protein